MPIGAEAVTQPKTDSRTKIFRLWNALTEPSPKLIQYEERRRATMLAGMLLLLAVLVGPITIVFGILAEEALFGLSLAAFLALITGYGLTRLSYPSLGAVLILIVGAVAPVGIFLAHPQQAYALALLVSSIFFSSVYFSGRVTATLTTIELAILVGLTVIRPEITFVHFTLLAFFLLTQSLLITLIKLFRQRDLEQQKIQAQIIADSEMRYRLLAENATDFVARHHLDGSFLFVSPGSNSLLGYEPDELLGKSPFDFIHPDDLPTVTASRQKVLTTTETDLVVYRFRRKDGSYMWLESTGKVIRDPQTGAPWEMITVSRDISRRKQAEENLRHMNLRLEASHDTLQRLIQQMPIGVQVFDTTGLCTDVNQSYLEIFGVDSRDRVIGQFNIFEHMANDQTGKTIKAAFARAAAGETTHVSESELDFSLANPRFKSRTGVLTLSVFFCPIYDENHTIINVVALNQDITQRKQIEENLRQTNLRLEASRDTLQRLIQQIPIGVQVFDTNGLCSDVNQSYLEIFGVDSPDQVIGKFNILEHLPHNEAANELRGAFQRALAGEIVHLGEEELDFSLADRRFSSKTEHLIVSVDFCPIYDENHTIISVVALNQDITERKQIEANLRQTNLRLEASHNTLERLIQQMPIGIQMFDTSGLCANINEAHMEIFGLKSRDQVIGKFNILTDHFADIVGTRAGYLRALAGEVTYVGEIEFDFKQADPRFTALTGNHFLSVSFFPVYDENLTIVGVVALNQDITERKIAERALKQLADELLQQKNTLNAVLSTTPDQLAIYDHEGRYLFVNPPGLAVIGADLEAVLNKTWRDVNAPQEIGERFEQIRAQVFATGQPFSGTAIYPLSSGPREFEFTLSPIFDAEGRVALIVSTTRDVTEQRAAERERLELALERERVKMLQHLISDTSHDLKTPLATLNTSLYLLKKSISDPERQERYAEVLQAQVVNLTKILEDMDSMARLDHANDTFEFEPVDLNDLLRHIVSEHEALASKKNQRLGFKADNGLSALLVDETKLRRAITNLVTNALNYTPEGGEIATCVYRQDGNVIIEIRDNGMGIAPNELALIFDRFYRSEESRKNYSHGSGLGLAITKKIVEGHGGTIQVESEVGIGSTFRIILPITLA